MITTFSLLCWFQTTPRGILPQPNMRSFYHLELGIILWFNKPLIASRCKSLLHPFTFLWPNIVMLLKPYTQLHCLMLWIQILRHSVLQWFSELTSINLASTPFIWRPIYIKTPFGQVWLFRLVVKFLLLVIFVNSSKFRDEIY